MTIEQERYDILAEIFHKIVKLPLHDNSNVPYTLLASRFPYTTKVELNDEGVVKLIRSLANRIYNLEKAKSDTSSLAIKSLIRVRKDYGSIEAAILWGCIKDLPEKGWDVTFYQNQDISEMLRYFAENYNFED